MSMNNGPEAVGDLIESVALPDEKMQNLVYYKRNGALPRHYGA